MPDHCADTLRKSVLDSGAQSIVMQNNQRSVRQVNLMIVENFETGEYSVFLTSDPMNIKTSRILQEAIVSLVLSNKYTNRESKPFQQGYGDTIKKV
jgi:hypothetical protein